MCEKLQKFRVYQIDFDGSNVGEPLMPGMYVSDDWRLGSCVPLLGEERQEAVRDLLSLFPEGVLEQDSPGSVRCRVGGGWFCGQWLARIMEAAGKLDAGNVALASGPTASLVRCVVNPLGTEFRFCVQDLPFSWTPLPSSALLRALACLDEGGRLYVGTVLAVR